MFANIKKFWVSCLLIILVPGISFAYDSAYSGAQIDAEIARSAGRNTTVGDPGSDAELVTEQAVREALDLKADLESPTLVTPALGTPSAVVLTNGTGLPYSGLANGTDGNIITWDADGAPAVVATGTVGQVLTSAGAGAPPTFEDATGGVADDSLLEVKLDMTNSPTDNYILSYDSGSGGFTWVPDATGAGGSAITLDIGDDGGNDSTDLTEIAITGDTNSIFTESASDKLLIAVGNNWPIADTANAGDSATAFFSAGTIEDARIASTITRDTEWNTMAKINAASTDTDAVLDTDIGVTVEAYDANTAKTDEDETITGTWSFGSASFTSVTFPNDSVLEAAINWGLNATEVSAADIPIADAGTIITATEVEEALQENRTAINLNTAKETNTDDQTAAEVAFTPNGTIAATTVQLAIQEVRDEAGDGTGTDDQTAAEVSATDEFAHSDATNVQDVLDDLDAAIPTVSTRASLNLDTDDSPQFAGVNIGAATDTTLTRSAAGVIAVEGKDIQTTQANVQTDASGGITLTVNAVNYGTDTGDADIPDGACDATGDVGNWVVLISDTADQYSLTSNDASNVFILDDNTSLTAGDELDVDGTMVCVLCIAAETWKVTGYMGAIPTDGGVAD